MKLQMTMQALQILCWLLFYFYPFLPTDEDPWYGTKIQNFIRYRSKHITYACVVLYNQVIPIFGVLSYLVLIAIRGLGYGFKDVEKGEVWLWISLYPLICITIYAYYQFKIYPEVVAKLAKEYKGEDRKHSIYHNRLADLIHEGFHIDKKTYKE